MKTFKELCDNKPSVAIQAMCAGLLAQSRRKDFTVDMSAFGEVTAGVCFGCAATCTAQRLTSVDLTAETVEARGNRARALGVDYDDLAEFEDAIDDFRRGWPNDLFDYFGCTPETPPDPSGEPWRLETGNWRAQLPVVRAYAHRLAQEGL